MAQLACGKGWEGKLRGLRAIGKLPFFPVGTAIADRPPDNRTCPIKASGSYQGM